MNKIVILIIASLCVWLAVIPNSSADVDVELNPVEISGRIQFSNKLITKRIVNANSGSQQSFYNQPVNPYSLNPDYSLLVNVEKDSSREYNLSASLVLPDVTTIRFPPKTVSVIDGIPMQVDFSHDDSAQLDIIIDKPTDLALNAVYAYVLTSEGFYIYKIVSTEQFSVTVPSDQTARVDLIVLADDGTRFDLTREIAEIPKDSSRSETFVIEVTDKLATVQGRIDLVGPIQMTDYKVRVQNVSAGSVSKQLSVPVGSSEINYKIDDVAIGNDPSKKYRFWVDAYYTSSTGSGNFTVSPSLYSSSNAFDLVEGEIKIMDVIADQAVIKGDLNVTGSLESVKIYQASAYNTWSRAYLNPVLNLQTYNYEMPLLAGIKGGVTFVTLSSQEGNSRQDSSHFTYQYPSSLMTVPSAGEVIEQDLDFDFGSVKVNFTVSDGSLLSSPEVGLVGYALVCKHIAANGDELGKFATHGAAKTQIDVSVGSVILYGVNGRCEGLRTRAKVGSSTASFGDIDLDFIAGVDREIDINGPTLTVDVEPNSTVEDETLEVTGTVTDDTGVDSVIVNGQIALLTSTNNPADVNEVQFSVNIPLLEGDNLIETIATDISAKTSKDKRKVIRQSAQIRDTDGPTIQLDLYHREEVYSSRLTVTGKATDESGVASVEINGVIAELSSSNNPLYPNEVTFSVDLDLQYTSNNPLTTIAKDTHNNPSTNVISVILTAPKGFKRCDVDGDDVIDITDIRAIFSARNINVDHFDPRDHNSDRVINVSDARGCQLKCDMPRCAIVN